MWQSTEVAPDAHDPGHKTRNFRTSQREVDASRNPDRASQPGDSGFMFDRFDVRVPTVGATPLSAPANDLQRSLVSGAARRYGLDPAAALAQIHSRQHAVDFFKRRSSRALL